jgi:hypothetical protein
MPVKISLAGTVLAAALGIILGMGSGCASEPAAPAVSQVQPAAASAPPGGVAIKQDPMTSYMQSQVGTPNELSPLAPAEATNIKKTGGRWTCDLNGRAMIFNDAASCWEPQR